MSEGDDNKVLSEFEFVHWLDGYIEGGATGGIEPISARLREVIGERTVIQLLKKGAVITEKEEPPKKGEGKDSK